MLDTELEGENAGTGTQIDEEERVANAAAAEFCVPKKMMDAFVARKAPIFSEKDVVTAFDMVNLSTFIVPVLVGKSVTPSYVKLSMTWDDPVSNPGNREAGSWPGSAAAAEEHVLVRVDPGEG